MARSDFHQLWDAATGFGTVKTIANEYSCREREGGNNKSI